MKTLLLVLIALHGLLHLPGFFKAFKLAELNELTLPISKPAGLLWLLAALLLHSAALLLLLDADYRLLLTGLALAFSQLLIILFWKDAKMGTIANLLILLLLCFSL